MIKITIKNQVFILNFQSSLTNELLIVVYDKKDRLLFEIPFSGIPDIEMIKEEIMLRLYPENETKKMRLCKQNFKEDFNILGDLFNPSLFGYAALNPEK